MSKAWVLDSPGVIQNLYLKDITLPALAPNQVRVRIHALGLNFADVFSVLGLYEAAPKTNLIPGLEYAGEIEQIGDSVTSYKVGDRVFGVTRFGAFVTHINAAVDYIRPIPDGWSYEQGCAFPVQVMTAYYGLLNLGNLKKGQTVLIHSAAGGVGILTIQILQKLGGHVVGTVSSQNKADFLVSKFGLQPHQIIVRTSATDFERQLEESLKKSGKDGVDLVFDSLSGDYFYPTYNKLKSGGRLVIFGSGALMPAGNLGYNPLNWIKLGYKFNKRPMIDPMKLMQDNKALMGFNLIWLYERVELFADMLAEIAKLDLEPPTIDKVFDFADAPAALVHFQQGTNIGKVVVTIK